MQNQTRTLANDPLRYNRAFCGLGDEGCVRMKTIDRDKHTIEIVIASETPVVDWYLPTSLRMKGVQLKRYKRNPVVLLQHNLSPLSVIARTLDLRVEDSLLVALTEFDVADKVSADVWGKIERGFVRAASVGFTILQKRDVESGVFDKKTNLTGPVRIADSWEPYEYSIVAVGADAECLGRSMQMADGDIAPERFPKLTNRFPRM